MDFKSEIGTLFFHVKFINFCLSIEFNSEYHLLQPFFRLIQSIQAKSSHFNFLSFEGIDYPQEVVNKINEIQNPTEENTEEENEE